MVMEVDDTLHPVPKKQRSRIRVFDTGNGDTAVDRLEDGGWETVELEDVVGMEIEHRGLAREEVGEAGGRDRGDEDGQERGHGQIDPPGCGLWLRLHLLYAHDVVV